MKSSGTVLLGFALLAIAAAIVIGSRLSDQAVAALAGAVCGIGLAAPLGLALGVYIGSSRSQRQSTHSTQPPQIVVIPTPSPSPKHTPTYPATPVPLIPSPRSFTIIGDSESEGDGRR